jgi:superfamily II DNA helicase RecQ
MRTLEYEDIDAIDDTQRALKRFEQVVHDCDKSGIEYVTAQEVVERMIEKLRNQEIKKLIEEKFVECKYSLSIQIQHITK